MIQDINEINNLVNDLAVARLETDALKAEYEKAIETIPELVELREKLESSQNARNALQGQLLEVMQSNQLKSWKTEQVTISRASRVSASVDPSYKKAIEKELKEGKEIMGWSLNTTEYISIRT